jgi:drug/metabolite transporter (DMT)-like permease
MTAAPAAPSRLTLGLALGTVYLIWGSTYLAIRIAVQGLPPFIGSALRFWVAGAILLAIAFLQGHPRPERRQILGASVVGLCFLLGGNGGIVWAEQYLSSGMAALIQATTPLWVLIVEAVLPGGSKPTWVSAMGTALGFAGVGMLIWPSLQGGSHGSLIAQVVLLGAALSWAAGTILGRRLSVPSSGLYNTGVANVAGATALAWLVRNAKPHVATTYAFVNPAVAVLLGAVFLAEPLTTPTVAGAGLIVGAVAMVILGSRRKAVVRVPRVGTGELA